MELNTLLDDFAQQLVERRMHRHVANALGMTLLAIVESRLPFRGSMKCERKLGNLGFFFSI